jgi:plasmid stabilization system protein ParE
VKLPLIVRPDAEADILAGRDWYDRRRDGLGDEFVESLRELFLTIQVSPTHFAAGYRGMRRAKTGRFPYIVYFRDRPECIEIIAVLHARRDPRIWQRRV